MKAAVVGENGAEVRELPKPEPAPNEILIKDPSLMDPVARTFAHYPGGHPEGYPDGPRNLFRNLYRYIAAGKKPGTDPTDFPTFEDGDAEVRIVEAVLKSNEKQGWVDVHHGG